MHAPMEIRKIYQRFDYHAMENLTKAWYYSRARDARQRTVEQMRQHRAEFGLSGNCFDLALWLIDEFLREGFRAYGVGHGLHTTDAHVAVVVLDSEGYRYLCDLGDQWIQPILIDGKSPMFSHESMPGFFPAARVQISPGDESCNILYHRPNGKISQQYYDLRPVEWDELVTAGEVSQNSLGKPLVEIRVPLEAETGHWEFYNYESWLSTSQGKHYDEPVDNTGAWAERISARTGMDVRIVTLALEALGTVLFASPK